jgi:hypothetical protein
VTYNLVYEIDLPLQASSDTGNKTQYTADMIQKEMSVFQGDILGLQFPPSEGNNTYVHLYMREDNQYPSLTPQECWNEDGGVYHCFVSQSHSLPMVTARLNQSTLIETTSTSKSAGNMLKTIIIGVLAASIALILISISFGLSVYCCRHRKKISNHSELFILAFTNTGMIFIVQYTTII